MKKDTRVYSFSYLYFYLCETKGYSNEDNSRNHRNPERLQSPFRRKYGIETLGLFGSVARGEQNEKSDIDVFIKLRKTSYYTLMDIKDDLEQVFRQKVDLITLHETMRALFRRKIEQDAIYL
ncbi:MAG: nucleotidyltransferase family protein [Parabacteroides merdae]